MPIKKIIISFLFYTFCLAVVSITILPLPVLGQVVIKLDNPLKYESPQQLIGAIIKGILGLIGIVSFIMFLWGGFLWLFSFGEPERVKKGLNTMLWAGAGLVAIFGSYTILRKFLGILVDTTVGR